MGRGYGGNSHRRSVRSSCSDICSTSRLRLTRSGSITLCRLCESHDSAWVYSQVDSRVVIHAQLINAIRPLGTNIQIDWPPRVSSWPAGRTVAALPFGVFADII